MKFLLFRSYANKTIYVRYDCNRRMHRPQFKFVKYQPNKIPVGLKFILKNLVMI
jgi:hypothetical protein